MEKKMKILTDNGYKAIKHQYAAGYNLPDADYYYRKYPINGPCSFKYERYFACDLRLVIEEEK